MTTKTNITTKPDSGNIPIVELQNQHGHATISLLGANLIEWTPTNQDNVIWLSEDAQFIEGQSIRGGIPICWPWFGAHSSNPDSPAHGFARTKLWQCEQSIALENGDVQATFNLPTNENNLWAHNAEVTYRVTLGKTLRLELITRNLGDEPIQLTQALHTYFKVGQINQVTVHGLEGKHYLDKLQGFKQTQQQGAITINEEVDRVYINTTDTCTIDDPSLNRKIQIETDGSNSTVVWNPWQTTADKMGDLGEKGYQGMLCVETANAGPDSVTIKQGDSYELVASYALL